MEQNSLKGLSVYGYVRQNFDQKCHIQEIIATIIQFYINKGGFLYICGNDHDGTLGFKEFYDFYGNYRYRKECRKPARVKSVKGIFDIAAGYEHTMMIDDNGSLWAVGHGKDGRLGTGNAQNVWEPTKIQLKNRAFTVSVGNRHSLILTVNGAVSSCGSNRFAQLGHGGTSKENQCVPKIIEALKQYKIIQISAGSRHNGALSENGDLFMWGNNKFGQCGVGRSEPRYIKTPTLIKLKDKVSVIECGGHHSLLITLRNLLYSFGCGDCGQLGLGTKKEKYIPKLIKARKHRKITNVAGGYNHTLCLDEEFNVWTCGSNYSGQCGHSDDIEYQLRPKKIEYFAANEIKAKEVTAGYGTSCVITQNNECFVFGENEYYEIGLEDESDESDDYIPPNVPTKLPLSVQKASMGKYHSTFISN